MTTEIAPSTTTEKSEPKTYSEVPWFRKNWFAIVCFFVCAPALLVIIVTGPIFYEKDGALKKYGRGGRAAIGAVAGFGTWMWISAIFAGASANVAVNCAPQVGGVPCTVQHMEGNSPAHVCWTVRFACQNGQQVQARACQDVGIGATASRTIPESEFAGLDACDQIVSTVVDNLVITEK